MTQSIDALVANAMRHSAAEGAGDMAETLGTLEANPIYELHPVGLKLIGMENARAYYENFFKNVQPRILGYELLAEWIGEDGVIQEYRITYKPDSGDAKDYRIIGILTFGQVKMSGERLYADEELLRIFFAPVWDKLVPV